MGHFISDFFDHEIIWLMKAVLISIDHARPGNTRIDGNTRGLSALPSYKNCDADGSEIKAMTPPQKRSPGRHPLLSFDDQSAASIASIALPDETHTREMGRRRGPREVEAAGPCIAIDGNGNILERLEDAEADIGAAYKRELKSHAAENILRLGAGPYRRCRELAALIQRLMNFR